MNPFPSASRRRTHGFSLVELITTLAVLMVLGGLLLPALARQLRRTATTVCLANQRQFALALELYGNDTGYYVPNSFFGVNSSPDDRVLPDGRTIRDLERSTKWVRGWLEFGRVNPDNTNRAFLADSHLTPLLDSSAKRWVCPDEDAIAVDGEGRRHPWLRTVSLNASISGATASPFDQSFYRVFRNPSAVPNPSTLFTFMEERADGINSCVFVPGDLFSSPGASGGGSLGNYPGFRHQNGPTMAFADGHVEVHRMKDPRTTPKGSGKKLPTQTPSPGNPDADWLLSHGAVAR
ncbi:MAG: prepilin-type N-terminal cleavage/methylation domain-containing protein [Verrucomicrobiales bacterium]|nr:prepilin-type N-terminal cleavage/methylation domain-containing protein [Verrucomicrobiales bacterium]